MSHDKIDWLCINTIRTLSMDAVEKAHSGHPGAPMALAPVAYQLWQQELRYDPSHPDVARPRPVRAVQRPRLHAALQAAAPGGRAARHRDSSRGDTPAVSLEDIQKFRQLDSVTPGHPEYQLDQRRGDHHRARWARAWPTAWAWPSPAAGWPPLQPARLRAVRLQRVRHLRRRRHDGGRGHRGRLDRRPPQAAQPVLDLRQQPHHHRRQHRPGLHRGRGPALRGLRLARAAGGGRQRPGGAVARRSSTCKESAAGRRSSS